MKTFAGPCLACLALLALLVGAVAAEPGASFESRWAVADSLHTAGDFVAAESSYRELLGAYPASQRTALRIAIVQEKQGRTQDALASYDSAYSLDAEGEWADVALFYAARCATAGGALQKAAQLIDRAAAFHPESPWTERCRQIDARIVRNPDESAAFEARVTRAVEHCERMEQIVGDDGLEDAERIVRLQELLAQAAGSPVALRITERIGHIQCRTGDMLGARDTFMALHAGVPAGAERSLCAKTALRRLAALNQALGDKEAALRYNAMATAVSEGAAEKEEAALERAGLLFERIQLNFRRGGRGYDAVDENQWRGLETELDGLVSSAQIPRVRDTATLIRLEVHSWRGQTDSALRLYREAILPSETASAQIKGTALFFVGDLLALQERNEEAIPLLAQFVDNEKHRTLWPDMDHYQRACYRLAVARRAVGDAAGFQEGLRKLESDFPDSSYTTLARELNGQ